MIKKAILIVLTGTLLITASCTGENKEEYKKEVNNFETSSIQTEYQIKKVSDETPSQDSKTSPTATLGGITLGDSPEKVIDVLGNNYSESTEPDIAGLIGEDLIVWSYESGVDVYIGKTSEKVVRITSVSPNFKTDLGIKVGDDSKTVFETYEPAYEEAVSRHRDEVLEGWFHIGEEAVIIFDFDKSDNAVVNTNVTSDSKVEEIILAYWKHFN